MDEMWRQNMNFHAKNCEKFNDFQFFQIFNLHKISIFGAKIQIIQVNLALKKSQKSLLFSTKIQIHNFDFV